jgi:hypothetical protein
MNVSQSACFGPVDADFRARHAIAGSPKIVVSECSSVVAVGKSPKKQYAEMDNET